MANYAISPYASGQLNMGAYAQMYPNLSVMANRFMNSEPRSGFEYWLQALNPSYTQEQALRRQYDSLYSRYMAQAAQGWPYDQTDWLSYLSRVNPQQEIAKLVPEVRLEQPTRFQRPVRVISF